MSFLSVLEPKRIRYPDGQDGEKGRGQKQFSIELVPTYKYAQNWARFGELQQPQHHPHFEDEKTETQKLASKVT